MTQPKIKGVGHGTPRTIYGSDGSNWYAIQVDSDGHVKIDVVSAALPTDAATDTVLQAVRDRIGALTSPAAGSVNKLLTDALTALQLIDDLRAALGSVNTDDLQVDVKTLVPPVPAAPVNINDAVSVAASTWTDLVTYTVSAGKKLYIHYWSIGPGSVAQLAGFNFQGRLTINDTAYDRIQNAIKTSTHIPLPAPIVASAGQVVAVEGYHAEAAARSLSATIIGFEV